MRPNSLPTFQHPIIFLCIWFFAYSADAVSCGQLFKIRGDVFVHEKDVGGPQETEKGVRVRPGTTRNVGCEDSVVTGADGNVIAVLNGTKLSLGPNSRMAIAENVKINNTPQVKAINLLWGKVRAFVAPEPNGKKSPQAKFKVKTRAVVVGVRGTDFFVARSPNGEFRQATLNGVVEVQDRKTQQIVNVEPGQQIVAQEKSLPPDLSPTNMMESAPSGLAAELKPAPIDDKLKQEIRVTSAVAKEETEFTSKDAVKIIGKPDTWTIKREEPDPRLKNMKEEF